MAAGKTKPSLFVMVFEQQHIPHLTPTEQGEVVWNKTDFPEEDTQTSNVHIRVQQRRGRKCVTMVEGLADDLDLKKICKFVKKVKSLSLSNSKGRP